MRADQNEDVAFSSTTKIPMTFRRRAGKAVIVLPNGERAIERREALIDNAMIKLIARGHRWHRQLFDGTHASIADIAKSENINPSCVGQFDREHPTGRRVLGRLPIEGGLNTARPGDREFGLGQITVH